MHIVTYKGYEINGNIFYIIAQDKRSTNQNSGVRIDATYPNGNKQTYYGRDHNQETYVKKKFTVVPT